MLQKKFILFALIGFFIVLLAPVSYVYADEVFIGITIDSAVRADVTKTFCLPNGTEVSIMDGGALLPNGAILTESPACAGQTIWSNLVTLQSGSDSGYSHNYSVKLGVYGCYGPVYFNYRKTDPADLNTNCGGSGDNYCNNYGISPDSLYPTSSSDDQDPANAFYKDMPSGGAWMDARPEVKALNNGNPLCRIQADSSENCNQACATAGLLTQGNCRQYDTNCELLKKFLWWKFPYNACDSTGNTYSRYNTTYGYQNTSSNYVDNIDSCSTGGSTYYRICSCSAPLNNFSFPFTPVF